MTEQNNGLLNGTFDNTATRQRESWVDGKCVAGVHEREIQQSSGSTKYLYPFGHYPDVPGNFPTQAQNLGRDTLIAALCQYYGDGVYCASEESAREALAQEDDPIEVMGKAMECYAADLTFEAATNVAIKWLNDNANPHSTIMVDCESATLYSAETNHYNTEFIKD